MYTTRNKQSYDELLLFRKLVNNSLKVAKLNYMHMYVWHHNYYNILYL